MCVCVGSDWISVHYDCAVREPKQRSIVISIYNFVIKTHSLWCLFESTYDDGTAVTVKSVLDV